MSIIDLNSDLGESFGAYRLGNDAAMMPLITSANIACGFHAGDPLVMAATLRLAREAGVAVGAHPGYPDLQGFGRREMDMSPEEVEACVLYQLGALEAFARAQGVRLAHVKPHGALYNQAARNAALASAVAQAVLRFNPDLILVGLAGSALITAGRETGLRVAAEAFPDRAYNPDGSLRSRRLPGAVLELPAEVAAQALNLAQNGINGQPVDTLCLHGDNPAAVEHARAVNEILTSAGLILASLNCSISREGVKHGKE